MTNLAKQRQAREQQELVVNQLENHYKELLQWYKEVQYTRGLKGKALDNKNRIEARIQRQKDILQFKTNIALGLFE